MAALGARVEPREPKRTTQSRAYFYDTTSSIRGDIKPRSAANWRITDVNRAYLARGKLKVERWGRACLARSGTTSQARSGMFIEAIEKRRG